MNDIQKLHADIKRRIKRSHAGDTYSAEKASKAVADYFISQHRDLGALPEEIAAYWLENRIAHSKNPEAEPTEQNISWLLNVAEILNGTYTGENDADFSKRDWQMLCESVNCEAENLPVDVLSDIMSIFVSKKLL